MADPTDEPTYPVYAEIVIDGAIHTLTEAVVDDGIDEPGEAKAIFDAPIRTVPTTWSGRPAVLRWGYAGRPGEGRFAGEVVVAEHRHREGGNVTALTVAPRLRRLVNARATRVFRRLDLVGLITALLAEHGLGKTDYRLALGQSYAARDWILQADETNWAFLYRQLAEHGVFTFVEVVDERDVIVFADYNAAGGPSEAGVISYHPDTGTPAPPGVVHWLAVACQSVPPPASWHVDPEFPAERPQPRPSDRAGNVQHVPPAATARQAAARAAIDDTAARARSQLIHTTGALVMTAPGSNIALDTSRHRRLPSDDYLITARRLRVTPGSAHGAAEPQGLVTDLTLAPLARAWGPERIRPPELPAVIAARVEADTSEAALLDEAGHYRNRLAAETHHHPYTEASPGMPALTPYASPTMGPPAGWHFPLRDATEVLVSCLNGDPDRPCLVAFAPSADQPGPVNGEDPACNRLVSPGGNYLSMDDHQGSEAIVLETFGGQTVLRLAVDPSLDVVELACRKGSWIGAAQRDYRQASGRDTSQRVGGSSTTQVTGDHQRRATTGSLYRQAKIDGEHIADDNLSVQAGQHIHVGDGRHLELDVERDVAVNVAGPDGLRFRLHRGDLEVHTAGAITIQGQGGGDIVYEQNGGGLAVLADGTVRLFGNEVSVNATDGDVQMQGDIDYTVPEGNTPTEAATVEPAETEVPDDLPDPAERILIELGWPSRLVALTDAEGNALETLPCWFATRAYQRKHGPVALRLKRSTDGQDSELAAGQRSPDSPDGSWDGELSGLGQATAEPELTPAEEDEPDDFPLTASVSDEIRKESS